MDHAGNLTRKEKATAALLGIGGLAFGFAASPYVVEIFRALWGR